MPGASATCSAPLTTRQVAPEHHGDDLSIDRVRPATTKPRESLPRESLPRERFPQVEGTTKGLGLLAERPIARFSSPCRQGARYLGPTPRAAQH
jgi:hypothetical protein